MQISRRQFIKYVGAAGAALGMSEAAIMRLTEQLAFAAYTKPKVVWILGQACTGCEISITGLRHVSGRANDVLHTAIPDAGHLVDGIIASESGTTTFDDVLLDVIDLRYIQPVQSMAGDQAMAELAKYMPAAAIGGFGTGTEGTGHVLVVTGAIPVTGTNVIGANACGVGAKSDGTMITAYDAVRAVAQQSGAVLACGACAAFGGIPAAGNASFNYATGKYKSTGASSVSTALTGISTPVLNIGGCPFNPNAVYLVVANYILNALGIYSLGTLLAPSNIDSEGRPKRAVGVKLFEETIHGSNCPRYTSYTQGQFATKPGDPGCLLMIGCKGLFTYAPCVHDKVPYWNDQLNFCINAGLPCQGCMEKGFPDAMGDLVVY